MAVECSGGVNVAARQGGQQPLHTHCPGSSDPLSAPENMQPPQKTSTKCIYFMKMQPEYSVTNEIKQYQIGLEGSASVSVSVSVSVRSQSV